MTACTCILGEPDDLRDFVHAINEKIKPIHIEIKKGVSEHDGSNYFILINTLENEMTR